ncbi:MAG: SRPBCC family protein [Pseudomonadota bacterium]
MDNNTITRQIQINADPERVWHSLTDYKEFGTWFHVDLDGPFVVGETTTGKTTYPGHEGLAWTTVTETLTPPSCFVFRWPHLREAEPIGPETIWLTVSFTLEPSDGGTLVTVTETGFAALPEDQRVSMLRSNTEGWDIQTVNLKRHVES